MWARCVASVTDDEVVEERARRASLRPSGEMSWLLSELKCSVLSSLKTYWLELWVCGMMALMQKIPVGFWDARINGN